jgi:hypothetical protein
MSGKQTCPLTTRVVFKLNRITILALIDNFTDSQFDLNTSPENSAASI